MKKELGETKYKYKEAEELNKTTLAELERMKRALHDSEVKVNETEQQKMKLREELETVKKDTYARLAALNLQMHTDLQQIAKKQFEQLKSFQICMGGGADAGGSGCAGGGSGGVISCVVRDSSGNNE